MNNNRLYVQLTKPCQENWENMLPSEQGRFCQICEKQVIDFSAMTDTEILDFWQNPKNRTFSCGQFTEKQLSEGIEMPSIFSSWQKIASISILGLSILGFPIELKAQTEVTVMAENNISTRTPDTTESIIIEAKKTIICLKGTTSIISYSLSDIQLILREKGYYKGKVNNTLDNKTQKSLQKFKKDNQLAADSIIDENTLKLLGVSTKQ